MADWINPAKKTILHQLAKKKVAVEHLDQHFQRFIFLLTRGTDLNRYDEKGYLPIHHAIEKGNLTFLIRLIEYGISPLALTQDGHSAKMLLNTRLAKMQPTKRLGWEKRLTLLLEDFKEDLMPMELLYLLNTLLKIMREC